MLMYDKHDMILMLMRIYVWNASWNMPMCLKCYMKWMLCLHEYEMQKYKSWTMMLCMLIRMHAKNEIMHASQKWEVWNEHDD